MPEQINAVIEDNGIGFNMDSLNKLASGNHFGLYGMRERIQLLAGKFSIRSSTGAGTRISIMIPLKQNWGVNVMDRTIKVVIADDHSLLRTGLVQLLGMTEEMKW